MRQSDKAMQHAQFQKATFGTRTFGVSIDYFCNLFKNKELIYFFTFGYVFLEIQCFGILTSYFQIFESEALETGIFAQHLWKPMGNNENIFYSDYRYLVLNIFENFNLCTLVSIRRNLGIYYFLREYSHLMLKNNIRTGLVGFHSILVEISYLGRAFFAMVRIFVSA